MRNFVFLLFLQWLCQCTIFIQASNLHNVHSFEKSFLKQESVVSSNFNKNYRHKRDASACIIASNYQNTLKSSRNEHFFRNDSNPSIALTWSGNKGVILALTTMSTGLLVHPSKLYRSTNRGKSFEDVSNRINNDYIRKTNGILVNPSDTSFVLFVGYDLPYKWSSTTSLYVTTDAGATVRKSIAPFIIDDKKLKFNPQQKYRLLALCTKHSLWISKDFGISWTKVSDYVLSASWDPLNADILYYTYDPLKKMLNNGMENELYRYNVAKSAPTLLAQHVHSFVVQDNYLLVSIQFTARNGSRVLHVSKNEGHVWSAAQLPMIGKEEFYSLLDMSEEMVFVHVDTPGDTGHGNIYTSDERGIVYSLSLERHLYPNNKGITDFYKVNCLSGVYITTQLGLDNTVHSRISFDKGGVWQPVTPPSGSTCPPTEKVCNLQIHNFFSVSKGVRLPALPLSSKNAVGLIMAHGNLGDGLSFKPPSVYITDDGGYTWTQPSQLIGPQFYAMGDSGGILFAVQSTAVAIDTLQFSLDEGQCWHPFKFSDRKIRVTGISAEPGEKATDISIWGWDASGDQSWMVVTVDFKGVLGQLCNANDYVTWTAHESNRISSLNNNCMLGAERTFVRRKKGTICWNGEKLVASETPKPCRCTLDDFLCDFGYKRTEQNRCVEDNEGRSQYRDICINDSDEQITTQGYRKIPGDLCQGGYEPERKVTNLHKKCATTEVIVDDFGVDPSHFDLHIPSPQPTKFWSTAGIVVFVILTLALIGTATFVLYRKSKSRLKIRYTRLANGNAAAANGSLVGTTSVIDDDPVLADANGKERSVAVLSYHDDSDDDLIVT